MDLDAMSGNCSDWLLWAWMTDEAISEANFLERDFSGPTFELVKFWPKYSLRV